MLGSTRVYMSSDPDDPKNKPGHSSGNDSIEPSPFLNVCLLFHPFIPPMSQCSSQWYSTCIAPVLRRQKHDTVCGGVGLRYFRTKVRSNRQTHRLDATLFQSAETRSNRLHQILILHYFRSYDRSNRPEQVYTLPQRSLYDQRSVDVTRLESFAIGIRFGCQFET